MQQKKYFLPRVLVIAAVRRRVKQRIQTSFSPVASTGKTLPGPAQLILQVSLNFSNLLQWEGFLARVEDLFKSFFFADFIARKKNMSSVGPGTEEVAPDATDRLEKSSLVFLASLSSG